MCTLEAEDTQSGWAGTGTPRARLRTESKGKRAEGSPLFRFLSMPSGYAAGHTCGVDAAVRDMLFCLNPPHSLPFPHWPDGATLPAAAAADVSLARARSSRTRLPARGSLQLRADSPAPPRWLQTRGHARARGAEGLGGGDARGRRQPPFSRPSLRSKEPAAPARQSRAADASLFSPREPWSASGTGPKKSRKSCLPLGERNRSSLCLESQHLRLRLQCVPGDISIGQTPEKGGRQVHVWFQRRIKRVTFVHLF